VLGAGLIGGCILGAAVGVWYHKIRAQQVNKAFAEGKLSAEDLGPASQTGPESPPPGTGREEAQSRGASVPGEKVFVRNGQEYSSLGFREAANRNVLRPNVMYKAGGFAGLLGIRYGLTEEQFNKYRSDPAYRRETIRRGKPLGRLEYSVY
jgi:hypothetical protein